MKLILILCALFFSLYGWCASGNPAHRTTRAIKQGHETVENVQLKEEIKSPLLSAEGKAAMIAWGLLIYLAVIFWWAIAAKNSLDKILKNVLRDLAQYAS